MTEPIPPSLVAPRTPVVGELTHGGPSPEIEWRVHDRTHLEIAVDYPVTSATHTWEAYFFVPASFRLQEDTYDKKAIYDDLWSYVRFATRTTSLSALAAPAGPVARVVVALAAANGKPDGAPEAIDATRRLRLFACLLRSACLAAAADVRTRLEHGDPAAGVMASALARDLGAAAAALREAVRGAGELSADVRVAARWVDEDVSLVVESIAAGSALAIRRHPDGDAMRDAVERLAELAGAESRHREAEGCDSVAHGDATARDVEHLEFRRHVMKRFTTSVLWLSLEVSDAAGWVVHALYALAAAVAMAFALVASVSTSPTSESMYRYGVLVVVAYAVKDRMKAFLQRVFDGMIARRFADRKWKIIDRERARTVGLVRERAAFLPMAGLPSDVLTARRLTRTHPLEEAARPERVLWHKKSLEVGPLAAGDESDLPTLTEIFRLNVRRWLEHADDPSHEIFFADSRDGALHAAKARRVYNVNVVYRLQRGEEGGPWRRLRVVVSRKGIERVDEIC